MFSVSMGRIIDEFELKEITEIINIRNTKIQSADVNRPGLQLAGFFEYFGVDRIQLMGKVEMTYLENLSYEDRYASLETFFKFQVPCIIIARGLEPFPEMIEIAKENNIPVFVTQEITSRFASKLNYFLNNELAPRVSKHGVLVELYGEGVLMLGESGVGKSETALELVKRWHRLVADDVVEVRKISNNTLIGTAPDIIRHFVEIRGIGILDVKNLYGVGSVKVSQSIDLIINMEIWDKNKNYDRLGLNQEYIEILGVSVPSLVIPVRPGRNLAIILEVAARNNRQKKMGYNAAEVLNKRVMDEIEKNSTDS